MPSRLRSCTSRPAPAIAAPDARSIHHASTASTSSLLGSSHRDAAAAHRCCTLWIACGSSPIDYDGSAGTDAHCAASSPNDTSSDGGARSTRAALIPAVVSKKRRHCLHICGIVPRPPQRGSGALRHQHAAEHREHHCASSEGHFSYPLYYVARNTSTCIYTYTPTALKLSLIHI